MVISTTPPCVPMEPFQTLERLAAFKPEIMTLARAQIRNSFI